MIENIQENITLYLIGMVVVLVVIAKIPGLWDIIKSIFGTIKKIFEVLIVSSFEWIVFFVKSIYHSHKSFLFHLITPRNEIMKSEEFDKINKRGGVSQKPLD